MSEQQQADGVLAVLDKYTAPELRQAREAVAEYIAANDEYDAARASYMDVGGLSAARKRLDRAKGRRAAAHARMKGETK